MRRFDLQHSPRWQGAFRGEAVTPGAMTEDNGLCGVRHYLLGDLTDDELSTLVAASEQIAGLLAAAPTRVVDLMRNPFNLWLAVGLLELGEPVASMTSARDQLQLLHQYWRRRVEQSPRRLPRTRVLAALVEAMLTARRLRSDESVVPTGLEDDLHSLLHDGVLQQAPTPLLASAARVLVFSHHILFDFAAAALAMASTEGSQLGHRLRQDPDLAVVARPSLDLHLTDLWRVDPEHKLFAATVNDLVVDDQVLAGIAAARIVIENVSSPADLTWLIDQFRHSTETAATITSWLGGVMEAPDDVLGRQLHATLPVWADFTETVTGMVEERFDPQPGRAALLLLGQLDRFRPLTPGTVDAPARAASTARLMAACLAAGAEAAWLAVRVARLLPRAVAVDGTHAVTLFAAIGSADLAGQRTEVLTCFVEQIDCIAHSAPDAAAAVLSAAWHHEDDRDEATYLTQGVLTLTTTRKQELDHLRWLTGERFAT
jgi:hypothetical protein